MSVAVTIEGLPDAIEAQVGWCYLLTTSDQALPRILAITPAWDGATGTLRASVSGGTAASVTARPTVTLLYPPAQTAGMSLIIDGTGTIETDDDGPLLRFTPATAVLHRPAPAARPAAAS
jgi:hypothetical protein